MGAMDAGLHMDDVLYEDRLERAATEEGVLYVDDAEGTTMVGAGPPLSSLVSTGDPFVCLQFVVGGCEPEELTEADRLV